MIPRRVRWLAVILPTILVGVLELLSDSWLDPYLPSPWDTILVTGLVAVLAAVFARWAFGRIDRLATSLEARNREVEARAATARALHSVSLAVASLADLEAILRTTVESARTLLHGDLGLLVLVGTDGEPGLRATAGRPEAFDAAGSGQGDEITRFLRPDGDRAILAAPLRRGGTTIGTLAVVGGRVAGHGVDDVETLSSLANQAAIAIENDRLATELRDLAVRRERVRIAGEIHDGLAQVLGYVNTKSQAVAELLEAGRATEAKAQMADLSAAARSIYVDVREAIMGLSGESGPGTDLGTEIRDYATRFSEAAKLTVSVTIGPGLAHVTLSPGQREAIFGIVREALTNIRKHARARRVAITLDVLDGRLHASVADDGRGFEPGRPDDRSSDWPHQGMAFIRARAAGLDGTVEWHVAPGGGTIVVLDAPVAAPIASGVRLGNAGTP